AMGEPLPPPPPIHGHAVEARLCAESPDDGFLPASGLLQHFHLPPLPGIRLDAGYAPGNAITPQYDPMIAKIIAHGATRDEARLRLLSALRQLQITGIATNR